MLKKLLKKIKTEEDVVKEIDEFIAYYNKEYHKYLDDLAVYASEFDRDYGFIFRYLNKKIGS